MGVNFIQIRLIFTTHNLHKSHVQALHIKLVKSNYIRANYYNSISFKFQISLIQFNPIYIIRFYSKDYESERNTEHKESYISNR